MPVLCCTAKPLDVDSKSALPGFLCAPGEFPSVLDHLKRSPAVTECFGLAAPGIRELYILAPDATLARQALLDAWRVVGEPQAQSWRNGTFCEGIEAVEHLLRVAAGLHGEHSRDAEILHEIDAAIDHALVAGACGGQLAILGRRAVRLGGEFRANDPRSALLGRVCDAAFRVVGKIHSKPGALRVLIVGCGGTARAMARRFQRAPVQSLMIAGPDGGKAAAVAQEFDAVAMPFEGIYDSLLHQDVLVTAVYGQESQIQTDTLKRIIKDRRAPLVVIDLSTPPWIDASVAAMEKAFWYDRAALESLLEPAGLPGKTQDPGVAQRLAAAAQSTLHLIEWPAVTELLDDLRLRAEAIRQHHLQRFGRKLDPAERSQFENFTDSLVRTILNDVTANIESIDPDSPEGQEAFEAMRRLLGVAGDEENRP